MAFYYDSHIVPDAAWRPAQDAGCAGRLKNLHFAGCIWQAGEALLNTLQTPIECSAEKLTDKKKAED